MNKIVEVKDCHHCPYYGHRDWWHNDFWGGCVLAKRAWGARDEIPSWCPLPDAPKEGE